MVIRILGLVEEELQKGAAGGIPLRVGGSLSLKAQLAAGS